MVFASGSQIGKYTLSRKLGQGGFGLVFAAHDSSLDREVALKFLKAEYTKDPAVVKRFLQEARAAAKVVHPGIVTVYECGQLAETNSAADGTAFIAMELLEGESLTARLARSGRLTTDAVMEIGRQAASALEAAHRAGIVHRDLKPDNVYLIPDPMVTGGERVKVLDFGIAKLAPSPSNTVQTESMMVFGTPRYMSPEQCKSSANVDHRSDIYTLGCILFELAAGRPPFVGATGELIAQHLLVDPPALSKFLPEVSPALALLIDQMLAKDPEQRPPSMVVIQRRLEACGAVAPGVPATEPPAIPEVTQSTGVPAAAIASAAGPNETTTLSSMARSRARSQADGARSPRRLVYAATAAIAVVVVIIVIAVRGDDPPPQLAPAEGATVKMQVEPDREAAPPVATPPPVAAPAPEPVATPAPAPAPAPAIDKRAEAKRDAAAKREAKRAEAAKRDAEAAAAAARREPAAPARPPEPAPGTLALTVTPPCDVFVDGKQLATKVTQRELELPAGRHKVTLLSSEHSLKDSFFVEIRPGAVERIAKEFNVPADKPKRDATINPFDKGPR